MGDGGGAEGEEPRDVRRRLQERLGGALPQPLLRAQPLRAVRLRRVLARRAPHRNLRSARHHAARGADLRLWLRRRLRGGQDAALPVWCARMPQLLILKRTEEGRRCGCVPHSVWVVFWGGGRVFLSTRSPWGQ